VIAICQLLHSAHINLSYPLYELKSRNKLVGD